MDGSEIGLLLTLVVLIVLSAFFSSTETAYSSLNMIRIKQMAKNGNKKAKTAFNNSKKFTAVITTILIGNNIVNILATSLATSLFTGLFGGAGIAVATGVMTVLILVFGEVIPKIMAKARAESFALFSARVIHFLVILFRPITLFVEKMEEYWQKKLEIDNVRNCFYHRAGRCS